MFASNIDLPSECWLVVLGLLTVAACHQPRTDSVAPPPAAPAGRREAGLSDAAPTTVDLPKEDEAQRLCDSGSECIAGGQAAFDRQDFDAAHRYYERACTLDAGEGCEALALSLSHGHPPAVARDERRAISVIQKACELNNLKACWIWGNMLRQGSREPGGYASDIARSVEIWRRACEAGEPGSCASLADCYTDGDGVTRNPKLAKQYRRRAEQLGYVGE